MTGFVCLHAGLEETSAETHVADDVEQLVAAAFIGETEFEVAEVTRPGDGQLRLVEGPCETGEFLLAHGFLHHDYGVLHVAALNQSQRREMLDLVEEAESAAGSDFLDIIAAHVPMGLLDSEDTGVEIYGDVYAQFVSGDELDV